MGIVAVIAFLAAIAAAPARAQMFSYAVQRPQAVRSLSFAYVMIDFDYRGGGEPPARFDYAAPAYGLLYSQPNLRASVAYGRDTDAGGRELRLLQASISTWGNLWLTNRTTGLAVPIGIVSNYRRVVPEGSEDSLVDGFNVTVLGLGAGLSYAAEFSDHVSAVARAMPSIGLALHAFGDTAGSSYLFDGIVEIKAIEIADRFGVSVSYGYRAQVWNVGASELLIGQTDDLFDYVGSEHTISLGLNW